MPTIRNLKSEIINLRNQGKSYREIKQILNKQYPNKNLTDKL